MQPTNNGIEGVAIVAEPGEGFGGIASKRKWILRDAGERGVERLIMLDDDLTFSYYTLGADGKVKLPRATREQQEEMFEKLWSKITPEIPHAGFGPRTSAGLGRNRVQSEWKPGRMLCVLGYHVPTVLNVVDFSYYVDAFLKEDMDTTLQLLRAGYPNAVTSKLVSDQNWGAPGGCSIYRTIDANSASSEELARLHPGYVRVVEKTYQNSTRKEVVVAWQKALRDGIEARKKREGTS